MIDYSLTGLGRIEPLTAHFGVTVHDGDVRRINSRADVDALMLLLAEKQVAVFKEQELEPRDLVEFTSRFGEPEPHVLKQFALPGFREIYVISNIVEDGRPIGNRQEGFGWHTDLSYFERPAANTILYALKVPKRDGETAFASSKALYEQFGEEEKARLRPLRARWDYGKIYGMRTNATPLTEEQRARTPVVSQPLVRIHPLTGQESLYVSGDGCAGVEGLPDEVGIPLVRELLDRTLSSPYTYRHFWEAGDLVVWDNRGLVHSATPYDMENDQRLVYRMSVRGERPIQATPR